MSSAIDRPGENTGHGDPRPTGGARVKARGYAAADASGRLAPMEFERQGAGPGEIEIEVLYCGICHSDIHQVKNEWANTVYPCMPGHEVVGRVRGRGPRSERFAVGDLVGVGCMIDSCGECGPCRAGSENYCESPNSWLATYNGPMIPAAQAPGQRNIYGVDNTYGGYSTCLVVKEQFAFRIPKALRPEVAAPILCAGVTTYSPLKHWGVKAGQRVGIVGFGGLGDMAIKIAKAMGAEVTVFTRTEAKLEDAARLGVQGVLETDRRVVRELRSCFDFILSTVPEKHEINPFVELLKRDSTLCVVGCLEPLESVNNQQVAFHRRNVAGSLIGSLAETQEVLDFCAGHGIGPEIELVAAEGLNDAYDKVEHGEVRYRYVLDASSLRA